MRRIIERVQQMTGIYGLGFDRDAMMGAGLPIGIVVVLGGLGFLINRLFL